MSYFKKSGTLAKGSVTLTNASPSQTIFTTAADEWLDVDSLIITTTDTAAETVTVTDGTTTLTYVVGGSAAPYPLVDQAAIPVRFSKNHAITVTANAVTSGKTTTCAIRGLSSKT